jgi:TolB protein
MNADGSKPQRLTSDAWEAQYPAWSPDGRRIAFVSLEHGNPDVYVMNADGSRVTQLTDDPGPDVWPVWSPDGRRIAFGREGERSELLVMEADGSNKTLLKAVGENGGGVPVNWAPGEWIAFNCLGAVVGQAGNGIGICAVRPEGTGFTRLLGGAEAGFPAWSPRR